MAFSILPLAPSLEVAVVLNFRQSASKAKVPNYLARGEQRRLLVLVLMVGLFLLLIGQAANPQNWFWLWRVGGNAPPGHPAAIDTRLPLVEKKADRPGQVEMPLVDAPAPVGPRPQPLGPKKLLPGLDAAWLKTIQDDTIFRSSEHNAFFHMLKLLEQTDDKTLLENSIGSVEFIQLYKQPDSYRGALVDCAGKVNGAFKLKSAPNELGITQYYQLWIEPADHAAPIVVYCLTLPKSFPLGLDLSEQVELTGFFFKRWAYRARDEQMHSTPLVLARSIHWTPAPPPKEPSLNLVTLGVAIGGSLLFSALFVTLLMKRRQPVINPYAIGGKAHKRGLDALDDLKHLEVAPDVSEALARIAAMEQNAAHGEKPSSRE
jgi:hypothetical protein